MNTTQVKPKTHNLTIENDNELDTLLKPYKNNEYLPIEINTSLINTVFTPFLI